jgi:hypothetical protein
MMTKPLFGTPLNRAHLLARGLVGCWLLNEGSGLIAYDLSGRKNHGTLSGTPLPTWTTGLYGSALSFPAYTNSSRIAISAGVPHTLPISFLVDITPTDVSHTVIPLRFDSGGTCQLIISNAQIILNLSSSLTSSVPAVSGVHYRVISTIADDGTAHICVNGVDTAGSVGAIAFGGVLTLGNYSGGGYSADGIMNAAIVWNRVLSAPEFSYLNSRPFCMFDPLVPGTAQIGNPLYGVSI